MRALTLVAVIALSGCSSNVSLNPLTWIPPYQMDIQQGNQLTADAVAKLKPGMTRSQVRFVLGTPLLNDAFHADRWDYKYRLVQSGRQVQDKLFTVYFKGDLLDRYEGDVLPAERPILVGVPASAPLAASAPAGVKP
ncbi:outer membrane protein assembly factor BamE [Paludibacterium yongneupense]|uniref:outer membrane protein assembly factor BamE n=1 Tax=Paludibacterium yongneupense TaxID=400061 RepID=UPI000415A55F|nr:outer membrane protein assembly factor BamE [Paludibacterium yongneupense]